MKLIWTILITTLILSSQSFASKLQPVNFSYKVSIKETIKKEKLYKVNLPSSILQNCAKGQPDIRVFYPNGSEIPYIIVREQYLKQVAKTYPTKIIKYQTAKNSAILMFKIIGQFNRVSSIELSVPDKNFRKKVELEGSNNNKTWTPIASSFIYDFSSQVNLRKTKLEFPASNHRFYRIKLIDTKDLPVVDKTISLKYDGIDFTVSGVTGKKLRIAKITAHTGGKNSFVEVYDEKTFQPSSMIEIKNNSSYITINSGLPFDIVEFDIGDVFFARNFTAYYSDTDKKNSYHAIASDKLYRFTAGWKMKEKVTAKISSPSRAFYRFFFQNRNNPPLNIKQIKLKWLRRSLYFIAPKDSSGITLSFGRPDTAKPAYDIKNFINQGNWEKRFAESLTIPEPSLTVDYNPELSEDSKNKTEKKLLIGIILLIAIGMGFWLYVLVKKASVKQSIS